MPRAESAQGKIYGDVFQFRVGKIAARQQPRYRLRQHPDCEMRNRIGALADRGSEVVAQVVDEYLVDADHQIQKRRAVPEHYPKQFGRLGRRVENRIDRDFELLGRRTDARLRLGQLAPQFSRAVLDQLDKDFVLGLEVQVEGAQADVGFGRDVGDSRLMVPLARDDTFGRLDQIDPRLLTAPIESIRSIAEFSICLTH